MEETSLEKKAPRHDANVAKLAGKLHEEWRQTRLKEDGTFEPRVKTTKDQDWISKHDGQTELDIANTSYDDLPEDWKGENKAAAEVAVSLVDEAMAERRVLGKDFEEEASAKIHEKWLERNGEWASPELKVPYSELPEEEKEKDRAQIREAGDIVVFWRF